MKAVVVGGGSAGWMSAATLIGLFPNFDVTVIESPNVPITGVGESTITGFTEWLGLLGIDPDEVIRYTNGSYKLSIHFQNFYKTQDEGFFYPFGNQIINKETMETWQIRKIVEPEECATFADTMCANMALVRKNKFIKFTKEFPADHYALHFDAVLFAHWLRERYCLPKGVKHIPSEVVSVSTCDDGINFLKLENGQEVSADL